MAISTFSRILLIDDLEMNNEITIFTIKRLYRNIEIVAFTKPVEGLGYIRNEYQQNEVPTLLLLDINMPQMNGWEVVDILAACDPKITRNLTIFMLSSSIDPRDKRKAAEAQNVAGFLERPLTAEMIKELFRDEVGEVV